MYVLTHIINILNVVWVTQVYTHKSSSIATRTVPLMFLSYAFWILSFSDFGNGTHSPVWLFHSQEHLLFSEFKDAPSFRSSSSTLCFNDEVFFVFSFVSFDSDARPPHRLHILLSFSDLAQFVSMSFAFLPLVLYSSTLSSYSSLPSVSSVSQPKWSNYQTFLTYSLPNRSKKYKIHLELKYAHRNDTREKWVKKPRHYLTIIICNFIRSRYFPFDWLFS